MLGGYDLYLESRDYKNRAKLGRYDKSSNWSIATNFERE